MSVLKTGLAAPSRMRGIFRYLLHTPGQREKKDILKRILSPDKLIEHLRSEEESSPSKYPMFNDALRESIKCQLLVEEDEEIFINPNLPEDAKNPQLGDTLLPDTLTHLLFASGNEDEADFGRVCAWYLAQDIYDAPGTWEDVEQRVNDQNVGDFLKMSSNRLFDQLDDWMSYLGLIWGHSLGGKRITVPDPTIYLRRNLPSIFNGDKEVLLREFVTRLAKRCPVFETGKFRDEIESQMGNRQPNYLSNSTAFALFRLQDEGYIQIHRKSDADFMILPKINDQVDDGGRISHITLQGKNI